MRKAISYSLFGFGKERPANCFDYLSYLRGLCVNIRLNRILFPGWVNVLHIDAQSYYSRYQYIFDYWHGRGLLSITICPDNEPLCKSMLWRLMPLCADDGPGTQTFRFDHVICRDVDSVATYREAQAVQEWITEDKAIHCITDSISHNIPMMGGMVGFKPAYVTVQRLGLEVNRPQPESKEENKFPQSSRFDDLMRKVTENLSNKGSDQHFMNRVIYPKCADSATEHFVKGMIHDLPEQNGRHYSIDEKIEVPAVPESFKCTNELAGHIGAAGYYEPLMVKFLNKTDPYRDSYADLEKRDHHLFYWRD